MPAVASKRDDAMPAEVYEPPEVLEQVGDDEGACYLGYDPLS